MSRSYKLAVYSEYVTRKDKRFASKAVRRYKGDISDGNGYKKLYCSWEIRDYAFDMSVPSTRKLWPLHHKEKLLNGRIVKMT